MSDNLLCGEQAVSPAVVHALTAAGYTVVRLAGEDLHGYLGCS